MANNITNVTEDIISTTSEPEPALSRGASLVCAVYITIVGLMATAGNTGTICLFLKARDLFKHTQNWLVLNLAVADIGISLFGFPLWATANYANKWVFGNAACQMAGFTTFWFSMVSYYTLAALGVYRGIHLCWPSYKLYLSRKNTGIVIAVAWLYGLFWPVMPFLGWGHYDLEEFKTSCTLAWTRQTVNDISMNIVTTIICFLVPLVVMVYCYIKILKSTKFASTEQRVSRSGAINVCQTLKYKEEDRVAMMCAAMVAGFVLTWGPYAVISILSGFYRVPLTVTVIPTMSAKFAPCVNFILYLSCNERFRKVWFREFCCCLHMVSPAREDPYIVARYVSPKVDETLFFASSVINEATQNQGDDFVGISSICLAVDNAIAESTVINVRPSPHRTTTL